MASPANSNQPVNTTLIRQRSKNGWTYVIERKTQYDDTLKRTVEISRNTVGKLPPGSTDIYDMVPVRQYGRSAKSLLRKQALRYLPPRPRKLAESTEKQGTHSPSLAIQEKRPQNRHPQDRRYLRHQLYTAELQQQMPR